MKTHKYHYTYKTTCKETNHYYLGMHSTNNLDDGYLGSGKLISRSINKHGAERYSIEILEYFPNRESLAASEKKIITQEVLDDELCLNLKLGGEGGWAHVNQWPDTRSRKLSPERCKQLSELHKGSKRSIETKLKMSLNHKGMIGCQHSDEAKQKIRDGNLKMCGENNGFFGKTHSEETKTKFKNRAYVNNGDICTCIKKDQIEEYLSTGWTRGKAGLEFKKLIDL